MVKFKTTKVRRFYRGNHSYLLSAGTVLFIDGSIVRYGVTKNNSGMMIDHNDFLRACGEGAINLTPIV